MITKIKNILTILAILILAGCATMSPEQAKIKLEKMGMKLNEQAFYEAIQEEDLTNLELLLIAGMDPNTGAYLGKLARWDKTPKVKLLLEYGADPNLLYIGMTPLQHTCHGTGFLPLEQSALDTVKLLVEHGADINAQPKGHCPALSFAITRVYFDRKAISQYLIQKGADVNLANNEGLTPLLYALWTSHIYIKVVKLLLENGADPNKKTNDLGNALLCSGPYAHKDTEVFELLLKHGAFIDAQDSEGNTPLNLAVYFARPDIVEFLIKNKANFHIDDSETNTPLDTAIELLKEKNLQNRTLEYKEKKKEKLREIIIILKASGAKETERAK